MITARNVWIVLVAMCGFVVGSLRSYDKGYTRGYRHGTQDYVYPTKPGD